MIKYVNVECWSGREDIPVEEVLRGLNGFQVANVTHRHYILCYVVSSVCGLIWCTVVLHYQFAYLVRSISLMG
jgi:accessory gene regulator protein AgrB